jgi:ATP synthase protein I
MKANSDGRDEEAALRARLDKLSGELKARATAPETGAPPAVSRGADGMGSAMSLGMRAGSEFIAAVVVGAAIGWAADRVFGTKPAFLILFFLLGVAAAVWNVIRLTSPKGASSERDSPLSSRDSPDKDVRRLARGVERDASLGGRRASGEAYEAPDGADEDEG